MLKAIIFDDGALYGEHQPVGVLIYDNKHDREIRNILSSINPDWEYCHRKTRFTEESLIGALKGADFDYSYIQTNEEKSYD